MLLQRKLMLIVSLSLLLIFVGFAQEKEEEPIPPKRSTQAKIGGALGFTQNWLFLDIDPINDVLKSSGAGELSKGGMLLLGGQAYGYVLLFQNMRIGGNWAGGHLKSKLLSLPSKVRKDIDLSVGFGGVTVDYVLPIRPRLDVAFGVLLGGGGMDIKLTQDRGDPKIWDEIWKNLEERNLILEYTRKLSGSFFVYQPSVNVEFAVLRWLGLRAGVGYLGMAGGSWEIDDKYELLGVPDNVKGKGFILNGGIFVGTFIF